MPYLAWENILARAIALSDCWKEEQKEEACGQPFTLDLMRVFGVDDPLKKQL